MKNLIVLSFLFLSAIDVQAKIWRVNNDGTKVPDFSTVTAAISAAAVMAGDTIHIEPSSTLYAGFTLTKRLVIIGNGYFLGNNIGLQANNLSSDLTGNTITINNNVANGSVISGLVVGTITLSNVSNITISHCLINTLRAISYTTAGVGINIKKCFISFMDSGNSFSGIGDVTFTIENNIFSSQVGQNSVTISFLSTSRGLFRNNTVNGGLNTVTLNNFYVSNNIFTVSITSNLGGSNNIIRNNLNAGTGLVNSGGNTDNINSVIMTDTFVGPLTGTGPTATGDARFLLKSGSPAAAAGETIGVVTNPACGAIGATDPYRLSGIPPVPSIYLLTVPTSVSRTATSMDITISTRSNN